jgi:hypothetical protein
MKLSALRRCGQGILTGLSKKMLNPALIVIGLTKMDL